MIYPYYEEFWSYLHATGKKVIMMCDGNVDHIADDVFACGADGIISEPYTDFRSIAAKHPDKILAGDGDCRLIKRGNREEIFEMVKGMCEWGKHYPGYFLCSGNNIPWDVPVDAVKTFFEAVEIYGAR